MAKAFTSENNRVAGFWQFLLTGLGFAIAPIGWLNVAAMRITLACRNATGDEVKKS